MAESPLFSPELRTLNATYDPAEASRLLDEIGLTKRNGAGIRLLPDGRELEIIVETDGESSLVVDGLTLISEFWREIGVKLFVKPQDRTVLRNRSFAGLTVMVAAQGLDNAVPTRAHAADRARADAAGQLRLAEMGPVHRDQGQERRAGRHPARRRRCSTSTPLDDDRRRGDGAGDLARDAREPCGEPMDASARSPARCSPIVVKNGLQNLPGKALYSWEPTAMIGIYRLDEMYWNRTAGKEASAAMIRFLLRRSLTMAVTLLIISALVFFIIKLPPGDFLTNQIAELQGAGRSRVGGEGRVPDQAIRPRPPGLGAVPRLDRRHARTERLLGPAAGRLGLVVRIRQAGQGRRRRRALADAARQPRGRDLHPPRRRSRSRSIPRRGNIRSATTSRPSSAISASRRRASCSP